MSKQVHPNISQECQGDKSEYRDRIDLLRSRVGLLKGKERLLITMYLKNGNSFSQMARLAGVNEATVSRKIHKVIKRLTDGEYITCLRHSDKFSKSEMDIARDYFLLGLGMHKIAKKQRLTYYRVRETMKKFQRLVEVEPEHKQTL